MKVAEEAEVTVRVAEEAEVTVRAAEVANLPAFRQLDRA